MLAGQQGVEWSNEAILHGGHMVQGYEAPDISSFGAIPSGEDVKVVQFRTPQDYRVTGGGVPQLAANATSQIPQ